jgi:hypothetical protein
MKHRRKRGVLKVIRRVIHTWKCETTLDEALNRIEMEYGTKLKRDGGIKSMISRELRAIGYTREYRGKNNLIFIPPKDIPKEQETLPIEPKPKDEGDGEMSMHEVGLSIVDYIESLKDKVREMATSIRKRNDLIREKDNAIEKLVLERRDLNNAKETTSARKDRRIKELENIVKHLNTKISDLNQETERLRRVVPQANRKFNLGEVARFGKRA